MKLDVIKELCEELDKLPSVEIEEEPIKHGHWVRADGKTMCSVCEEDLPKVCVEIPTHEHLYGRYEQIDPTPFCPNCGAKMDEDIPTDPHNVCPCD